ncbi:signal peptidase I [Cellvibrio sp. BR]|jgi:signal peptidase I|uniref:signal peptidase I n=1 Tax=unclassified Cellvibrio TaxID=2624793 RepID=UPI000260131F|nr:MULTISPECIES: signal peptidase I [unclassified Cellvibrio]EIK43979.1 signal peptidase I [Cellvibrio sp. BR]QEY13767.1 signal peptidase I [Cellvibrio sp. KY-YJ-3]UUA72821.1 signal peptidase I [Cellvibrio sp. QJXJ]
MSSINLPLILTLAVLITGLVWLFDALVLSRPRKQKVAAVEKQFGGMVLESEQQKTAYEEAKAVAAKEPMLVEYSKSFFPVLFIVFFLRSFLVEPFQIPSGSMIPTLEVGDFILVNKFAYGVRAPVLNKEIIPIGKPQRGDVMVFFPPHAPETYYIKRVIGIPGDHITYNNHQLTINGTVVEEKLIAQLPAGAPVLKMTSEKIDDKTFTTHKYLRPSRLSMQGSWVVPAGHYFMMGDNRDNSLDSREWGMVSEDAIVGKAFAVWMHWDSFFSIPSFDRAGVIQ